MRNQCERVKVGATTGRLRNAGGRQRLVRLGFGLGMGIVSLAASTAMADQAWWAGLAGSSWTAGLTNWDTTATSGTPVSAFPGFGTDVFFSTTSPLHKNDSTTPGGNTTINSVDFTARSGSASINLYTLTLMASGGTGITVEGGPRGRSIASVLLGQSQTWINNGPTGVTTLSIGSVDSVAPGAQLTIGGTGTTTITGKIGSNVTGGLVKTGTGTLGFGYPLNSFSGNVTINGGIVGVGGDASLGVATNGIILNSGGTFAVGYDWTLGSSRSITVNGSAASPSGLQVGGNLTTGAGQIKGNGALLLSADYPSNPGYLYVTGANTAFTGQITVGASGQVIGDSYNARWNETNPTTAALGLQSAGTLSNATGVTVAHGSFLSIAQSSTAVTGRLGTAALTFHSGRFEYDTSANGGSAINDTFGNVTVTGEWNVTGSATAGPAAGTTLNFGTLTRNDHATIAFSAPQAGTQGTIGGAAAATSVRMLFSNLTPDTSTSGTTRSVIPWASGMSNVNTGAPDSFMTYDANGFRPLNFATETTPTVTAGANVRLASSLSIPTGGISINSLSTTTNGGLIGGNATASATGDILTITSGALANGNAGLNVTNATLNFPNGGYIYAGFEMKVYNNSRIIGSGGIVIGSNSELQFTNTPTGGNTFTGGLYINGSASVTFNNNNQLGNDGAAHAAGAITLGGGGFVYVPSSASTASLSDSGFVRAISVNESSGNISTGTSGATLQIPGTISGAGQVEFGGGSSFDPAGVVELTNSSANTYTGGTVVGPGILRISNSNQLGTGALLLDAGTLQASANLSFASAPRVVAVSTIDTQTNSVTLTGGLNGSAGNGGQATSMTLLKKGTGTLTIGGSGDFAGKLNAMAGRILMSGTLNGLGAITIAAGASVELGASSRFDDTASLTLSGGTFATDGFSEDLGPLTLTGNVNSVIDLGAGSSHLTLADSHVTFPSWSGTGILDILNWSGSAGGGGTDQIFFGTSASGLTASQVSEITFVNPAGFAPGNYAAQMLSTGELVAVVPEPGSFALALCGGIALAVHRRRMAKGQG